MGAFPLLKGGLLLICEGIAAFGAGIYPVICKGIVALAREQGEAFSERAVSLPLGIRACVGMNQANSDAPFVRHFKRACHPADSLNV